MAGTLEPLVALEVPVADYEAVIVDDCVGYLLLAVGER